MLHKTEGIVLRSKDYGESHKIITLLTKEQGKLTVMARGAKKPRSRLAAISQLFTYGLFLFYRSTPRKMGTLSQGDHIRSFNGLRYDLVKTAYAAYFAELVDKLVEEDEPLPTLFMMLLSVFTDLDEGKDPELLARLFELKIMSVAGYKPEVDRCLNCRRWEGPFLFSVREGGFLCLDCRKRDPQALRLGENTLKLMRFLYHLKPAPLGKVDVRTTTKNELRQALWLFMDEHIPFQFKSRSFLKQLDHFWHN